MWKKELEEDLAISTFTFDPDEEEIAVGMEDNNIRIYRVTFVDGKSVVTFEEKAILSRFTSPITDVQFSPNGEYV